MSSLKQVILTRIFEPNFTVQLFVCKEQGGSFDPYLSHELQSKLQLSQRLAREMDKFRNQLLHQATVSGNFFFEIPVNFPT